MTRISEATLEEAIFDWLDDLLDLWDGQSQRDDNQIAMIWHMQHEGRYKTPILMGRITAINRIGRDSINVLTDNDGDTSMGGTREFMLYLEYFGIGAIDVLEKIKSATEDPASYGLLIAQGIATVEASPIIEAHRFLGTTPEDRAMLDIRLRTSSTWTTNRGIPIEEVAAEGNGYLDGLIDMNTITVDASTITI